MSKGDSDRTKNYEAARATWDRIFSIKGQHFDLIIMDDVNEINDKNFNKLGEKYYSSISKHAKKGNIIPGITIPFKKILEEKG